MCQQCRGAVEESLIEASRDPHLIALVLAGHTEAKWFREHLRLAILELRTEERTPADLAARLAELGKECPAVSGHCGKLLQQAGTMAEQWCSEALPSLRPERGPAPYPGRARAR